MRKKLETIQLLELKIQSMMNERETLKLRCYDLGLVSQYEQRTKGAQKIDLRDILAEMDEKIEEELKRLEELKSSLETKIDELNNICSIVLRLRYFEHLSFLEISKRVDYALSTVYALHNRALNELEKKERSF